ncbi:MAG: extracellular solute-binding protein, partial [Ruthenibacterium sp.]
MLKIRTQKSEKRVYFCKKILVILKKQRNRAHYDTNREKGDFIMSKKIISVFLAAFLALSMVACGGNTKPASSGAAPAPKEEKIHLTYYSNYVKSDDDLRSLSFHERYAEFQELYPEVELEILTDGHEAWQTKMKTLLASGEVPDVFAVQRPTLDVYHESGAFYDMSAYINENPAYKDGMLTGALDTMRIGDAVYGVPINAYSEGIFYNTEIFEQNGLEFPKTFEDLLACCKALSAKGITPIATGAKDAWPVTIITQFFFDREAGLDTFKEAIVNKDASMNTPEYKKAFEDFIALKNAGAF